MKWPIRLVNRIIRFLIWNACKIDAEEFKKIPEEGPYILAGNHINFLEVPLLYHALQPRNVVGMAKAELFTTPFIKHLMKAWNTIPIKRGVLDRDAMRRAQEALEDKAFFCLAPEGTRSGDGKLLRGRGGTIFIAAQSGVPIIPVAHFGGEKVWKNLKRFKKTPFTIRVGKPFRIKKLEMNQATRQEMADQLMYQIALLLPPEYRGYYSDIEKKRDDFLEFID